MGDWSNFDDTKQVSEWTTGDQSDLYKNIDYKNEWLDVDNTKVEEVEIDNQANELYDKLGLQYESFFDGPKLFHSEQTRRRKNL